MHPKHDSIATRWRARVMVASATFAAAALHSATAESIDIPNASFEEREQFEPFADSIDKYNQWRLESWRHFEVDNNGGPLRIWNPGAPEQIDPQGSIDVGFGGEAAHGSYAILVRSRYNDDEFHDPPQPRDFEAAVQLLETTFDPANTYTLTASVGRPPGSVNYTPEWFGYALQIAVGGTAVDGATFAGRVEGGTVIAEDLNSLDVPPDTWVTASVTYEPDPAHAALAGQPLQIRLAALEDPDDHSLTGWVAFDDVKLDATPTTPTIIPVGITLAGDHLDLTWTSRPRKLYNLLRSDNLAGWTLVEGGIPATPDTNSKTVARPADPTQFYRVEEYPKPPEVLLDEDFDDTSAPDLPPGWTTGAYATDAGTTTWQLGTPVAPAPAGASSPPNCVGTNLAADYTTNSDIWLRTPATIDLTDATRAEISFRHWVNMDNVDLGDTGTVRILDAAGLPDTVTELAVIRTNIQGVRDWTELSARIPNAALGKTVAIEFRLVTDVWDFPPKVGWFIDDVRITAETP